MSSSYFNMSFAAVSETSPNATSGDQSFDTDALSSQGYQESIVYYPIPSYYHVYNVVTPVEMNGATFYYYSAYAVPFYNVLFDGVSSASSIASDSHVESPDYALANLFEDEESVSSVLFDGVSSASSIASDSHVESPDYALANLFEDEESVSSVLFDDVSSASSIASDSHVESPDYALADLFEDQERVNSKLRIKERVVDGIPLNGKEGNENNVLSDKSEEMLDSTNVDHELSCEDVYQQIDKCHGDYDKEFRNDAVVKLHSDSMNESTYQKESSEGSEDNWEFLQDLAFDNLEDQDFKIEASYSGPSENELLGQPSFNDLNEDAFNSPYPCRKVYKKLRYFKREIEVLPTIYEEDESPEDDVELPDLELPIDEVESSKNPKKKRFKRLRRWFSQLTSCCRKNKKPPD